MKKLITLMLLLFVVGCVTPRKDLPPLPKQPSIVVYYDESNMNWLIVNTIELANYMDYVTALEEHLKECLAEKEIPLPRAQGD